MSFDIYQSLMLISKFLTSESSVIVTTNRVTRPSVTVVSLDLVPYRHETIKQYRMQR